MRHETFEQLVARLNAGAYIPHSELGEKVMAREFKLPKGAKLTKAVGGGVAASKYPWDEWFSGKLLLIERSSGTEDEKGTITTVTEKRDFEVARDAMPAKIKTAARRRYKVVDVYKRDHNGQPLENSGLLLQARDMTAEERTAEDLLRAEEREQRKAALDEDQPAAGQTAAA